MNTHVTISFSVRRLAACIGLALGGIFATTVASASASSLINDDFNDGTRTGWFNASSAGGLSASTGALVSTSGSPTIIVYFSSTILAVGESLSLSFDFSAAGIVSTDVGFRFGLVSSSGTSKVAVDNFGSFDFDAYEGYRVSTNLGSSAASKTAIYKGSGTTTSLFGGSEWAAQIGGSTAGVNLTSGTTYQVTFEIERTGETSVAMSFSMNDVVISSSVDNAASNFTFDTLGFYKGTGAATSLTFDNVSLVHSAIPEPANLTTLLGGLAVAATLLTRRPRGRSAV
ncbi:MAG: hypothetical protein WC205_11735 [Opitutaceae bacterium]|jgi:hypothetical protein